MSRATFRAALWAAFIVSLSPSCVPAPQAGAPHASADRRDDERAIAKMLDDWHDAAAKADEARYFDHLAPSAVFLGTDATERWSKEAFLAYAHPHFAKGKAWSFRSTRRAISFVSSRVACFDEDLATKGLGPARGSGVVELDARGRWKILQYNLAITVPNERFDAAKEAAGSAAILSSKADPLKALGFLSGAWVGTNERGEQVEEHWTHAAGKMLLASGRVTRGATTTFFELLRIEQREDGAIVLVAQPFGKAATEFRKVASEANEAVFENPSHDWPKRIRYRAAPGELQVRVEGDPGQPVDAIVMKPALVERVTSK